MPRIAEGGFRQTIFNIFENASNERRWTSDTVIPRVVPAVQIMKRLLIPRSPTSCWRKRGPSKVSTECAISVMDERKRMPQHSR
jgi:hypothetical protein